MWNSSYQNSSINKKQVGNDYSKISLVFFSELVFSDTIGNISAINASSGLLTGRFRGIAGAVVDLYACQNHPYLITVSLDRRLRVFEESGQRRLVKDVSLLSVCNYMVRFS